MSDSKSKTQRLLTAMSDATDVVERRNLPPIEDFNTIEFYFHFLFQQNSALMKSVAKLEEVVIVGNGTPSLRERMNLIEREAAEAATMRKALADAEADRKKDFRNHLVAVWTTILIGILSWVGPYVVRGISSAIHDVAPASAAGSSPPAPAAPAFYAP